MTVPISHVVNSQLGNIPIISLIFPKYPISLKVTQYPISLEVKLQISYIPQTNIQASMEVPFISLYGQQIPRSQTADKPVAPRGEPHNNHETPGRQSSSLFPIKIISKLFLTQSNALQNMEQLQNPTMGALNDNEPTTVFRTTALERTAA